MAPSITIADFNTLAPLEAQARLMSCCGSLRWAQRVVARRPYADLDSLLEATNEAWWLLDPDDWLEAFSHHPRIGERASTAAKTAQAREWSEAEQSRVADAGADVRTALEAANWEYEARFGHIFIVCATGKSAGEMLELLRARISNAPDDELRVAAGEQAKITALRLRKLFGEA